MLNYLSAISRDVGELRESVARLEKTLTQVQGDVKEIKLEMRVLREDVRRVRLDHEELVDRVTVLESKQA
jgi:regulator of replication initiation timing